LTEELDDTRLFVNPRGVQAELNTFVGALSRQGCAPEILNALGGSGDPTVTAARAKKAIGCLLWTSGVPAAQLERTVMQHWKDRNAIGPVRAVAARTRDVIETVVGIARELHPTSDLNRLSTLLPAQLELGIPADLVPIAIAGADLQREHYLRLADAGLTTPEMIGQTDDDKLIVLVNGDAGRLRSLREAVIKVSEAVSAPSLDDLLPPPVD